MTMRNINFTKLPANYLFPEINQRKKQFLQTHPEAQLISLGIGDTSEPIPSCIADTLSNAANNLKTVAGYHGYGLEVGQELLRKHISTQMYREKISSDDISISDGAKCDLGRLQMLFGPNVSIAVPDPAYPVYLDGSLLLGVQNITSLSCTSENQFWPDWTKVKNVDLIYWCSPNNPTGVTSSKSQLSSIVQFAQETGAIVIFDAAYAGYIQDKNLPRSIYEIEGAEEVAIEVGSFSKLAGFSGVRLGWTVVPDKLKYRNGHSVKADWKRLISTIFNGASYISQAGGLSVLSSEGMEMIKKTIQFYLENCALIKNALVTQGFEVYGGEHAPYLWVKFPGKNSWEAFQDLLERLHLVTTPGSGFGRSGEGYLRFSAFGHRETILQAVERLNRL